MKKKPISRSTKKKPTPKKKVSRVSPKAFFESGIREGIGKEILIKDAQRIFPNYNKKELEAFLKA